MESSTIALLTTVLVGLFSIPFISPNFDASPRITGQIVGINNFTNQIPQTENTILSPDELRKEIKTPYGKFVLTMNSNQLEENLIRPDSITTIIKNSTTVYWELKTSDFSINITKTPYKSVTYFVTPNGWMRLIRELGEIHESWYGFNYTNLKSLYNLAFQQLNKTVSIMNNISIQFTGSVNKVLINEFLSNPIGDDDALKPNGEWIELYNPTSSPINLSGWYLTDSDSSHILQITNDNTENMVIQPNDFIVLYRNGNQKFSLNNHGDTIRLFDSYGKLIDEFSYSYDPGENRSIGRCPDGSDIWEILDHLTPGSSNC